jgi:hypothetical protein
MQRDSGSQELEVTATRPSCFGLSLGPQARLPVVFLRLFQDNATRRYSWGSRSCDYEGYRIVWYIVTNV